MCLDVGRSRACKLNCLHPSEMRRSAVFVCLSVCRWFSKYLMTSFFIANRWKFITRRDWKCVDSRTTVRGELPSLYRCMHMRATWAESSASESSEFADVNDPTTCEPTKNQLFGEKIKNRCTHTQITDHRIHSLAA